LHFRLKYEVALKVRKDAEKEYYKEFRFK